MKQIKFTEDIYTNCTNCTHFDSYADRYEDPLEPWEYGVCEYEFDDEVVGFKTMCNYFKNNNTI